MILRSLYSKFLDISSNVNDAIVGPPLRITLAPGQIVTIDDSYRTVAAITNAINMGLLELVSYSNSSDSYVVAEQVQQLVSDSAHAMASSGVHGVSGSVTGTTDPQELTSKIITSYGEGVGTLGSISGSNSLNLSSANVFTATVTAETTFTFTNPKASGYATSFVLILTNGGDYTINWPNSVYWPNCEVPSLTASGIDILTFITTDGGTTWHGIVAQSNSAPVSID